MFRGLKVAVVVPAFMEERLIGATLGRMPSYVDAIYVIDDGSKDRTAAVVEATAARDRRVTLLRHMTNRGVGAAIVTGYRRAMKDGADVLAVMAGDDQMHPDDLEVLLEPIRSGRADYVKGNRFLHPDAHRMPLPRRLAGRVLSAVTRIATGLRIDDSQCGYTALSTSAARRLDLRDLWPRFGYPNDFLGMLAAEGLRVVDVAVRPVYEDEASGVRPWHVLTITALIVRRFWLSRGAATAGFTRANLHTRPPPLHASKARRTSSSL